MAKQQVCSPSASAITNAEARKEPNNNDPQNVHAQKARDALGIKH